ncbi:MAG TPA: hypothetical protein VLC09_20735 [Polyangiaceae bacterium]|nr:hypothetical protein [Polyangiaceae bacterium]
MRPLSLRSPFAPRLASRLFAAVALLGSSAVAADYLPLEPLAGKKMRLDGALLEWPGGFARLEEKVSGSAPEGEVLIGYDDTNLYVAAKVQDTQIARTAGAGEAEDHLTLELFFPSARGANGTTHRVDVFPGLPGKLPGVVKVDGKVSSDSQAIEAADAKGLVLEAQIPWSALPEASTIRVGLRGKVAYTDARSPGQVRGVAATSRAQGARMPSLPLASESGLIQALLEPRHLSVTPARDLLGDVYGDGRLERVALYDHFLSITGPGYRDGKQFYFNELEVEHADGVTRLSLVDVNGDGKAEIVIGKRLGTAQSRREIVQVLRLDADGAPQLIFAQEVAITTAEGSIENGFEIRGQGKDARLTVSQGKSSGFTPDNFREPTFGGGVFSALLPWEKVGSRTYAWKGTGLALLEEKPFEPKIKSHHAAGAAAAAPAVKAPPPPRPPTADELLDRVYGLYRKDRGVGNKKPRFDFVTDVAEDTRSERVLVHDKDIVVFGAGFKGGAGYSSITVGVKDAKDVLAVTARDLTGDGKAEILVHAVLPAQASKELGSGTVERQALFVYGVRDGNVARLFAIETGRALGSDRLVGGLRFSPTARGFAIVATPLRAIGWTQRTYPFPEDTSAAGGLEPLLLPWGKFTSRRYEFDGTSFVLR